MSTNATVIAKLKDRTFKGITVFWDGDFDFTGRILDKYYQDPSKVQKLVSLGDVSSLGVRLATPPVIKKYGVNYNRTDRFLKLPQATQDRLMNQQTQKHYTTAYHRDWGRKMAYRTWQDLADVKQSITNHEDGRIDPFLCDEYVYAYYNHAWHVLLSDEFRYQAMTLKQALRKAKVTA